MRRDEFRQWLLIRACGTNVVSSNLSRCKRVELLVGDLDNHYIENQGVHLLEQLGYMTDDALSVRGNRQTVIATLKSAVKLYMDFCRAIDSQSEYPVVECDSNDLIPEMKDSYARFLDCFGIEKESFYRFGLEQTIFAPVDFAASQWLDLKDALLHNKVLSIRRCGRKKELNKLYLELYAALFKNTNIKQDSNNNGAPRRNMMRATGEVIGESILNYQCAHIFGWTKNPLLFEAVWNICFVPKIYDPLTGHESKGLWSHEYQKRFHRLILERFENQILDYNRFIIERDIHHGIRSFVKEQKNNYEMADLVKFQKVALDEWSAIVIA